jgi:hypothetical protein
VDLDPAVPSASRRTLLGTAGAAGLLGAATVLLSDGAVAAAPPTDRPHPPTPTDTVLLRQAQELELTAGDLYQLALDAGADDGFGVFATVRANHGAYAEAIAGATGVPARGRNDEVFDSLQARFDTSDVAAVAEAGRELEDIAVATHTALLGQYESVSALNLTGSILVVEARQATVLGDIEGDELEGLLEADGEAVEITAEVTP